MSPRQDGSAGGFGLLIAIGLGALTSVGIAAVLYFAFVDQDPKPEAKKQKPRRKRRDTPEIAEKSQPARQDPPVKPRREPLTQPETVEESKSPPENALPIDFDPGDFEVGQVGRLRASNELLAARVVQIIQSGVMLARIGTNPTFLVRGVATDGLADGKLIGLAGLFWVSGTTRRSGSTYYVLQALTKEQTRSYEEKEAAIKRAIAAKAKKAQEDARKLIVLVPSKLQVGQVGEFQRVGALAPGATVVRVIDEGIVLVRAGNPTADFSIHTFKKKLKPGQRISIAGKWDVKRTMMVGNKEVLLLVPYVPGKTQR